MNVRFPLRAVLAVVLALPLTGCLFRSHRAQVLLSNAPLQAATLEQLVSTINTQANKIQTLNSTADIAASSGGSKKGKITEYKEVKGYILVRQPTSKAGMISLPPHRSTRSGSKSWMIPRGTGGTMFISTIMRA